LFTLLGPLSLADRTVQQPPGRVSQSAISFVELLVAAVSWVSFLGPPVKTKFRSACPLLSIKDAFAATARVRRARARGVLRISRFIFSGMRFPQSLKFRIRSVSKSWTFNSWQQSVRAHLMQFQFG
jgi:hypothetical protein